MTKRREVLFDRCGDRSIRTTINDDGSATITENVGGKVVRTIAIDDYKAHQQAEREEAERIRRENEERARERREQQAREDERAEKEFRRAVYGGVAPPLTTGAEQAKGSADPDKPRWDGERCTLYFRGNAVRKVRPIAVEMCKLLQSFEEEGWSERIYNPLTPDVDLSRQLRDLNKLIEGPLRFHRDGSGEGILWEVTTDGDG